MGVESSNENAVDTRRDNVISATNREKGLLKDFFDKNPSVKHALGALALMGSLLGAAKANAAEPIGVEGFAADHMEDIPSVKEEKGLFNGRVDSIREKFDGLQRSDTLFRSQVIQSGVEAEDRGNSNGALSIEQMQGKTLLVDTYISSSLFVEGDVSSDTVEQGIAVAANTGDVTKIGKVLHSEGVGNTEGEAIAQALASMSNTVDSHVFAVLNDFQSFSAPGATFSASSTESHSCLGDIKLSGMKQDKKTGFYIVTVQAEVCQVIDSNNVASN